MLDVEHRSHVYDNFDGRVVTHPGICPFHFQFPCQNVGSLFFDIVQLDFELQKKLRTYRQQKVEIAFWIIQLFVQRRIFLVVILIN